MGRGCGTEELWWAPSFQERGRLEAEEREREAARQIPPAGWEARYAARRRERVARGCTEQEGHWFAAQSMGAAWVWQDGDRNYYGVFGCSECHQDAMCTLCEYAERRGTTANDLLSVPWDLHRERTAVEETARAVRA